MVPLRWRGCQISHHGILLINRAPKYLSHQASPTIWRYELLVLPLLQFEAFVLAIAVSDCDAEDEALRGRVSFFDDMKHEENSECKDGHPQSKTDSGVDVPPLSQKLEECRRQAKG